MTAVLNLSTNGTCSTRVLRGVPKGRRRKEPHSISQRCSFATFHRIRSLNKLRNVSIAVGKRIESKISIWYYSIRSSFLSRIIYTVIYLYLSGLGPVGTGDPVYSLYKAFSMLPTEKGTWVLNIERLWAVIIKFDICTTILKLRVLLLVLFL